MTDSLHEATVHGSRAFPFALYHVRRLSQPCAISLHWHEEVELILVQQGVLNLSIEKQSFRGLPGDVFIVNSREIHEMSVTQVPTVYVTILFPLESLLFQQEDGIREKYLLPLAENALHFRNDTRTLACLPALREKLEAIITLYHRKEGCYPLKIRTLLLGILCDCFSEEGALIPAEVSHAREKQRAILGYIHDNFQRELTLEAVAQEFHMVPKYFSRYFIKTFHISLTEHITSLRLEKAAELLRGTETSVTEIAMQTGFNSCSYFNKQFRKAYRVTPTQYRKQKLG